VFALLPIRFSETKRGGGGDLPLFLELIEDGLIRFDRGAEVAVGFFFQQPLRKLSLKLSAAGVRAMQNMRDRE